MLKNIPFGFFGFGRLCSLFEKPKKADIDIEIDTDIDTEKETDTGKGYRGKPYFPH